MKHEWRKQEKALYLPKTEAEIVDVPAFKFLKIEGKGNPNSPFFAECIGVLYSMAYAIKMNMKKLNNPPKEYLDWAVYPLEGIWDISDEAKASFNGTINKDDLVFKLMLRQPNFVEHDFFLEMLEFTKKKKPHQLLEELTLENIEDGRCIQMMHLGSFDDEPASFKKMEAFTKEQGLKRRSKMHREIYLSDFRKVPVEKRKTVLRFQLVDDGATKWYF